jgi:quinol-cytochrome oxidoreductase complex cytochrome b subunit
VSARLPRADAVFVALERRLDRAFGARANPLRQLGALAFLLFWMLAASGIILYVRFDTSVYGAYQSIENLEWWFGGLLRGMHRYAADAFVIVVLLHLARELAAGRCRGFRAFSWISGLPALWLLYASGVIGYWLVWDSRAQFSALATAEWFDALPLASGTIARNFLAGEAVVDRLFSLFVFLHIGLPLALLAAMWVHVQRLGQPRTVAALPLWFGTALALLVLALAAPAVSHARWDPLNVPTALGIDWFLLLAHPLMYATSPQTLWLIAVGGTLALTALPWIGRAAAPVPARVDPDNCSGCVRCIADCPYQAVLLNSLGKAEVLPERCAACGICAGACPSSTPFRSARELTSGIDLPQSTVHALRERLDAVLAAKPHEVRFRCASGAPLAHAIELHCIAMLPPSFIEYALRRGAGRVRIAACRNGECAWRLGDEIAAERFAAAREPHLRATVRFERLGDEYTFAVR